MIDIFILEIYFKEDVLDKIDLYGLEKKIAEHTNILSKKFVFNNKYEIDKLCSYLQLHIDKRDLSLENELKKLDYVKFLYVSKEEKKN